MLFAFPATASEELTWTGNGELKYKIIKEQIFSAGTPTESEYLGQYKSCFKTKFITKPNKYLLPGINKYQYQNEESYETCAYPVNGGYTDGKYYQKYGTNIAGKISTSLSANSTIYPIPNSDFFVQLVSAGIGSRVYIINNGFSKAEMSGSWWNGSLNYTINNSTAQYLKDPEGNPLLVVGGTVSISDSGKWMAVYAGRNGLFRINLATGETKRSGYLTNSNAVSTAISDDGRYLVAATVGLQNYTYLYDINGCGGSSCARRKILDYLISKDSNILNAGNKIHFKGSNLNVVIGYKLDQFGNKRYAQASIAPTNGNPDNSLVDYLALGDSFASGEGAYNYYPYTNYSDNLCHLSTVSYPFLIKNSGFDNVRSVACSGAKMKDITLVNLADYNNNDPQGKDKLEASYDKEILDNYLPGYRAQLIHVEHNKPKIITMSMSGNDLGFSSILQKCVIDPGTCYGTTYKRMELSSMINFLYPKMVEMFDLLKTDAPGAKIYIIGYPQIIKSGGNCAINVGFNEYEASVATRLVSYFNSRIKMAATQAGIAFVDTEDAFDGYKLCEGEKSALAVNGLVDGVKMGTYEIFGKKVEGPQPLSESYHPNAIGHQLYATTINQKTNGFTLEMPDSEVSDPWVHDDKFLALKGEDDEYGIGTYTFNNRYDDNLAADYMFTNIDYGVSLNSSTHSLKPSSEFSLVMESEPIDLGTALSDSEGNINTFINIPSNIKNGYHTLNIRGVDIFDQPIQVQKIVYVGVMPEDIDGDGIPNTEEVCLVIEPSGLDEDKDGIDDACDGFISEPPEVEENVDNIGIVENPEITSTTKDLPVSESRPQWLMDLEAEIQARNDLLAQQEQEAATDQPTPINNSNSLQTAVHTNSYQTTSQQVEGDVQTTPQSSSATAVRGIEDIKPATTKQPEPYQQGNPFSWIVALPITFSLLIASYFIYRWFTTQEND